MFNISSYLPLCPKPTMANLINPSLKGLTITAIATTFITGMSIKYITKQRQIRMETKPRLTLNLLTSMNTISTGLSISSIAIGAFSLGLRGLSSLNAAYHRIR